MGRLVVSMFSTLDGVIQGPGGPGEDTEGGFPFSGWQAPFAGHDSGTVIVDSILGQDALLLGRKTYDIFAAHWPYLETSRIDPLEMEVARTFNRVTKFVATHSPGTLTWHNSQSLGSDIVASLRALKQKEGPQLLIQGSSNLIQTLLAHDLIDEFRVLIYPLVLGKGKRLFGEGTMPAAFKLMKSAVSPSGVLIATYERDGDIKTGSFAPDKPSAAEIERRKTLK